MLHSFLMIFERDIRLACRHASDTVASILFFLLCAALFPLALGPSLDLLQRIAPGIIWVCALLASMLSLERLFSADHEDGTLDAMIMTGLPLGLTAFSKFLAHWVTTGLPLIIIAAPIGVALGMSIKELPTLIGSLALGTPLLSLIGGMIAAIVLGARQGALLLPLLTLPLITPILIFGASMVYRARSHLGAGLERDVLGAFLLIALPSCCIAAGAAIRAASQD